MNWIQSALYPLAKCRWQATLVLPSMWIMGGLVYAVVSGGGFLYIVGHKPMALGMALIPLLAAGLLCAMLLGGIAWHLMESCQNDDDNHLPTWENWSQYMLEGLQLLLFYGLITAFLVSTTMLLMPFGLVIPLLVLAFHPLLMVPMLRSTYDKSFLGLLDSCLDIPKMLQQDYARTWAESTLYLVVCAGLFYPLLMAVASLSVVGVVMTPSLMFACLVGYGHLMTRLNRAPRPLTLQEYTILLKPEAQPRNIFYQENQSLNTTPFAHRESPWKH